MSQQVFLEHLRNGHTIVDSCKGAGISISTAFGIAKKEEIDFARAKGRDTILKELQKPTIRTRTYLF